MMKTSIEIIENFKPNIEGQIGYFYGNKNHSENGRGIFPLTDWDKYNLDLPENCFRVSTVATKSFGIMALVQIDFKTGNIRYNEADVDNDEYAVKFGRSYKIAELIVQTQELKNYL